ncbi:MAG TPA: 30S ribosomal protein S6 [Sedimentisphaerales bacterium]|nr:30S ribosomal protein S6 [Sedimentisphaerales bacterium]
MKTIDKKLYEAMFLVDSVDAASDWDGIQTTIKNILKKVEAEVVSLRKWDDRRLAYDIDGKSKGTYILCYFRTDGRRNHEIERAVRLSERIMRALILRTEDRDEKDIEKDMQKDTPTMLAEKDRQIPPQQEQKVEPEKLDAAKTQGDAFEVTDEPVDHEETPEDAETIDDEEPTEDEEPMEDEELLDDKQEQLE